MSDYRPQADALRQGHYHPALVPLTLSGLQRSPRTGLAGRVGLHRSGLGVMGQRSVAPPNFRTACYPPREAGC